VSSWFFQYLAGLRQNSAQGKNSEGFSRVLISPPETIVLLSSVLHKVEAFTQTPYGKLSSSWEVVGGQQCRTLLPRISTTISCGKRSLRDGGTISNILVTSDCTSSIFDTRNFPELSESDSLKNSLVKCIGKSDCEIPPVNFVVKNSSSTPVVKAMCTSTPALFLDVEIPPNSVAEVHINKLNLEYPILAENQDIIFQNGKMVETKVGCCNVKENIGENVLEVSVGSGKYSFSMTSEKEGQLVCGIGWDSEEIKLLCPFPSKISSVGFASYGYPLVSTTEVGRCPYSFGLGDEHFGSSMSVVENLCIGKTSCTLKVSSDLFFAPESVLPRKLATSVYCSM